MPLFGFPKRTAHHRQGRTPTKAPPRWPVDPELRRRTAETQRRIEHTRRQIARHPLPDRKHQGDHG